MKAVIWDEDRIREELRRLDGITGLHGADLPIRFGQAKNTLGSFYAGPEGKMAFRFSNIYFQDPTWPVASALDVIRHEYSHYLSWVKYKKVDHGPIWKLCATKCGAVPVRCYTERRNNIEVNIQQRKEALLESLQNYRVGQTVLHPVYDEGRITAISDDGIHSIATVEFQEDGIKQLSLSWIEENCITL